MDDKLKAAYRLAQQMDDQGQEWEREQKEDQLDQFLNTIAQIESSGGRNFNHAEIQSGMHKGHRAAGTYGLMPNTVYEVLNRMRQQGEAKPEYSKLATMEPDRVKSYLETNPEVETALAKNLARRTLDRQGDEEKAAYSWFQGHNLTPEEIEKRDYQDHDYVQKYRKYKEQK